jgi:hypothetical protein
VIVSASRRTDIPAFFLEWFLGRLRAGFVLVRNPFNSHEVSRIQLNSDSVDCLVFWTKDPGGLVGRVEDLQGFGIPFYVHVTITPYGGDLEPRAPGTDRVLEHFEELSDIIGPHRVLWRYDPILLGSGQNEETHYRWFEKTVFRLGSRTDLCVISFLHLYRKCGRVLSERGVRPPDPAARKTMAGTLASIARAGGLTVESCAGENLEEEGVAPGRCIDDRRVSLLTGRHVPSTKDPHQRERCGCVRSVDVGAYDTCLHGCLYCYATANRRTAEKNRRTHDPESPMILGRPVSGDRVHERT